MYVYGVMQLSVWTMFHALGLCWGIVFPVHNQSFRDEGKIKYILVASVIFALLFPTIPALLYLEEGYAALFTPTRVCTGRSIKVTYFAFLLPSSIILGTTTFALFVVFWTILKVNTVEPPILDHPRKGHCMLDLSIKDIAEGPKN